MPQPRKPLKLLQLSGGLKNHPGRYKDRLNEPQDPRPTRGPSSWLSKDEKAAYREILKNDEYGIFRLCDCIAIDMTAKLLADARANKLNATGHKQLLSMLGKLGMTPKARMKLNIPVPMKKNKFDDD